MLTRGQVLTGIDVLVREDFKPLKGLRVGLITNHTGIDRQRRRTIDLLAKAKDVTLVALFSPEHGIAGKVDEKVGDTRRTPDRSARLQPVWGTPCSGPGTTCGSRRAHLRHPGHRLPIYTYSATLGECLAAAGKAGKKFFVLDRPNPIGGVIVEGPVLTANAASPPGMMCPAPWHDARRTRADVQ
jgi:uncharacterized protein YbbC (DUF1343 family)